MERTAGSDDADPGRLTGRRSAPPARGAADARAPEDLDADREADDDADIEAVTRLMGFLRGDEDEV
jgi:hypothetical protein